MPICNALFLYGYSGFGQPRGPGILEYCEPYELLIREKYYLNLLNPEYNICTEPRAPMTGRKHSKETIEKFRNRKHSEETKNKMSIAKKISSVGKASPMLGKTHSDATQMLQKCLFLRKGIKDLLNLTLKK